MPHHALIVAPRPRRPFHPYCRGRSSSSTRRQWALAGIAGIIAEMRLGCFITGRVWMC